MLFHRTTALGNVLESHVAVLEIDGEGSFGLIAVPISTEGEEGGESQFHNPLAGGVGRA